MNKIFFPVALFMLALIAACSGDRVSIVGFSPTDEVSELTTFTVTFSEDIAPTDKIGEWIEGDYIDFEPEIEGKYKWSGPNTLEFSPIAKLRPGEDYTASINSSVLSNTQKKGDFETYSFHTPYFDISRIEFFWTQIPRSEYKVTVQANLYFNYLVDPGQLKDYMTVYRGEEKLTDFDIVTNEPASTIAVNFGKVQQTEEFQDFRIVIEAGLESPETSRALVDARKFDHSLEPLTRLAITSVSPGISNDNGYIEVFTTQAVTEEDVKKYVSLDPKKSYQIFVTENSFRLDGDFEPGSQFDLTIKKGMPGLYGGQLEEEYNQAVVIADLDPQLEFVDAKGKYLMRGGKENITVRSVNVRRANIKIYQVFANNLLYYLYNQGGGYYSDNCCGASNYFSYDRTTSEGEDYYYDDYYYDDYYYGSSVSNYGQLIHKDSVIMSAGVNRLNDFTINLGEHFQDRFKGVYLVEIRDNEEYWRNDYKLVSLSDLGMIVKRSSNTLKVFVNSIATTQPVEGVKVAMLSTNNQKVLTGTTDAEGVATFDNTRDDIADFTPRMVTAVKGDDFNFVDFKESMTELSRYDVGGKREYNDSYETFIYADRNLFRPGETAHFNVLVRDRNYGTVSGLPLRFKVTDPRGRTFMEKKKDLSLSGNAEMEVSLPGFAATGDYTLEVYSGDRMLMGSYKFSLEEFVPDKIRVEAEADDKTLKPGEKLEVDIFAEYLFGVPCADHAYEVDVNLNDVAFTSKKYKNYTFFNPQARNSYVPNELDNGKLDAQGKAEFTWTAPNEKSSRGKFKGRAFVSVFDATGRTVSRVVPFEYFPYNYYLGIERGAYFREANKLIRIKTVALDPMEKQISNFKAEAELLRYEWRTVLVRSNNGNGYRYKSERKAVVEEKKPFTINGESTYSFTPRSSGKYELRLRKPGSDHYTSYTFYIYGYNYNNRNSFAVDREGRVEIVTDKEKYSPGETAKVLFTTPFSGRMLVTLERENVLEHRYIDVQNNSAQLEIPINDDYLPNFFVSATLIRPHETGSGTPFFVGHGYAPILVESEETQLALSIEAPDRIKPRRSQPVTLQTEAGKDVYVTLALVDEGILQIKNYKTPDPHGDMYAKRKLSVSSYDIYELLMEEAMTQSASIAGGDEEAGNKRINPITAKRFKLLSFWSGTRKADASGKVTVNVPIPQFNGSARIMAVAWSGKQFGSAEKFMNITDDVVMMPAIPRFLSPNDSIILPISLLNTTDNSGKVTVSVTTEGPLTVTSGSSLSTNLGKKGNGNLKFGIKVGDEVGVAKIKLKATGLDQVSDEIEIAVRPTAPLTVTADGGSIKAGSSQRIALPQDYVKGTEQLTLSITNIQATKFARHLRYLVGYPHGCLEQTTSKLFPQLYFEELAAAVAPNKYVDKNPVYYVKEGIRKLQGMRTSDGSFSYWPGSYYNWWSSVYATHFLVEAQKKGYDVDQNGMRRSLRFLARMASEKELYDYRRYRSGSLTINKRVRKEIPYTLYVLALAGEPDKATMNYFRSRPDLLTTDSRYLLAGAFALTNDWRAFNELMPEAFAAEVPERESGRSFDSPIRANAMILNVLAEVDPKNKQIPQIVRYLNSNESNIYSTQDRVWVFLALGKIAGQNKGANVKVTAAIDGKSIGSYENKPFSYTADVDGKKSIELKASGNGEVYYFWSVAGVPVKGSEAVEEMDKNLRVRRQYLSRDGTPIAGRSIKQGELVVCRVQLSSGLRGVENIAITDLIPAGMEIDNPRLGESTALPWLYKDNNQRKMNIDYQDVRDDRMLIYTGLQNNYTVTYYYMLRAVNAGKFQMAPIGAEAMYDPDYRSYNGGGTISIAPR